MRKNAKHKKKWKFHFSRQAVLAIIAGIFVALVPMLIAHGGYSGEILVADSMTGEPFEKSLILLDWHGVEGAAGVILNKPLTDTQRSKLSAFIRNSGIPVGYGGPLGFLDRIIVLEEKKPSRLGAAPKFVLSDWDDAVRAAPDLLEKIKHSIKNGEQRYRVFTGAATWSAFQLETEILVNNKWHALPSNHDLVFQNGEATGWDALEEQELENRKPPADQS